MSQKMEFVERARKAGANIAELCREYGVSRQTGYKWLRRFKSDGVDGLEEQSRRPRSNPGASSTEVVLSVVEAREAHPTWGPKKLETVVRRKHGKAAPSRATIARILDRVGQLRRRRRRRVMSVVQRAPSVTAHAPNEIWTVDFKGWWRSHDGGRCEPLTVRDAFSRFVLATRALQGTRLETAKKEFERLFRKYGLPKIIQCDNGSPFICTQARGGLTRLSAWWVALGIQVVRSRPGCPQDNGAHERMHRDIRAEVQAFPSLTRAREQRALDRWRQEFNNVRPHEALGGKVPADLYKPSKKRPVQAHRFAYPSAWLVRRVTGPKGRITVGGSAYVIGAALIGHNVGLEEIGGLRFRLWFGSLDLGEIEIAPSLDDLEVALASENAKTRGTKSNVFIERRK